MTIKRVVDATSQARSKAKDVQARKLIKECAAQLLALNDGNPIPARWRRELIHALGRPSPRGAPRTKEERNIAIAHRMLLHDLDIEEKRTAESRSQFALALQDEYGLDQSYILRIAHRYRIDASVMEIWAGIDLEHLDDEDDEGS